MMNSISRGVSGPTVNNLGSELGHSRWRTIGCCPINNGGNGVSGWLATNIGAWSPKSRTSRVSFSVCQRVTHLRLGFANMTLSSGETYGENQDLIVTIQRKGTTVADQGQMRLNVTFNGARQASNAPGTILWSDPIPFGMDAHEQAYLYITQIATASNIVTNKLVLGAAGDLVNGEGFDAQVDYSTTGSSTLRTGGCYGPSVIQGYVADAGEKHPSVLLLADSIGIGYDWIASVADSGPAIGGSLGYMGRALVNEPWANHAYPSSTLQSLVANATDKILWQMVPNFDVVMIHTGGNGSDATGDNATIGSFKGDYLRLCLDLCKAGKKVIALTILPRTTSTDQWQTVANQSIVASLETTRNRAARNAWMLGSSGTDLIPMVKASCPDAQIVAVDAGLVMEVNSSNVPTVGGPYIKASTLALGNTTASSATSTTLVKTGAGWTVNAFAGMYVWIVSGTGAAASTGYLIASNTSDTLTIADANHGGGGWGSGTPDSSSHFIITSAYTKDGTHPSPLAHAAIAALVAPYLRAFGCRI